MDSNLRSTNHPANFGDGHLPGYIEIMLDDLMNLLLQLRLDLWQKIGFDSVEEQIVLPGLVDLVHFLVKVVVNAGDGVDLGRHVEQFVVHA